MKQKPKLDAEYIDREEEITKQMLSDIEKLNLENKESIVNFLFWVQDFRISCRRAATEIQNRLNKGKL